LHEDAGGGIDIIPVATTQESVDNNIELVVNPSDPTPPESSLNLGSANFLTGVALTEPPMSSTKGRKYVSEAKSAKKEPTNLYNTYNRGEGKRESQTCHVRGHYSTTFPQNPNRSRAAESKSKKRGGKLKVGVQEREAAQGKKRERMGIRKKGRVKGMTHNNLIALWLLMSS
jgi:hypothetical protein